MLAAAGDDNYKYFVMGNPWTIFSNVVVVVFFVAGSLLTLRLSLKSTKKSFAPCLVALLDVSWF